MYADFRRKAFGHAVDEINEQLTLDLTYEEVKNGRSVDAIIFRFRPTFVKKVFDPVTQKDRTQITKPRQKTELTLEELAKKDAKRAKEKEYRDRHKAKKAEKLTHIDSSENEDNQPDWNIFKTEDELNSAGVPQNKRAVRLTMEELADLKKQWQLEREQEEAKKIINPETKPRKKIFGIF